VDTLWAAREIDLGQEPIQPTDEAGADQRVLEQEARLPLSPATIGVVHAFPFPSHPDFPPPRHKDTT
jgi:hypothetical protein